MAMHKAARGLALGLSVPLAVLFLGSCTIVKNDVSGGSGNSAKSSTNADGSLDAKTFVAQNWSGKIVPDLEAHAAKVEDVVQALAKDAASAEKKYGRRGDETAPFNFVVVGSARIKSIDTESAAGTAELDVPDVSGDGEVRLQIGPVIKGSSLRDSLSFIKFGDFVNQLDYANISREINFYARDNVLADLRSGDAAGKVVSFVGAFTEDSEGSVLVTPVQVKVEK